MDINIEAQFRIEGNHLWLSYQVDNFSRRDVFLLNRLVRFDKTGAGRIDKDLVYIAIEQGPMIHLSKRCHEVPPFLQVYAREVPYATLVRSGQRFTERIGLELPLHEYNPYLDLTRSKAANGRRPATDTINAPAVYFSLGYIVKKEGIQEMAFKSGDEDVYYFQGALDVLKEQDILRTPPQKIALPLLLNKS